MTGIGILVLVLCCFYAEAHKQTKITPETYEFLKNVKVSQLPRSLRLHILRQARVGDSSNWCCKNDAHLKVNYTQVSKVVSNIIKVADTIKVGSDGCGFLNTHTCNTYDVRYHEKLVTHIEYDMVPMSNVCPDAQLTCCPHFVPIGAYCLENNPENLIKLQGAIAGLQGLLGR